jgi:hypothetical protein
MLTSRLVTIGLAAWCSSFVSAQCTPSWSSLDGGVNSPARALGAFNDGGGDAMYVGGSFTEVGGEPAVRIAKWDGDSWSPLGSGVNNTVNAIVAHNDGSGAALYAGGAFDIAGGIPVGFIARWNGSAWSAVGSGFNGAVKALIVFNNELYAGGDFTLAGATTVNHVARWNGATWSALATGTNGAVNALAVFNSFLHVGGSFTTAGVAAASNVARWNGTAWVALGAGTNGVVNALASHNPGPGAQLFVGGAFTAAGTLPSASRIARWTGATWLAIGAGANNTVNALSSFTDLTGPALYCGGSFTSIGGTAASRVARWNGTVFAPVGTGVAGAPFPPIVNALSFLDQGSGNALFVAGFFNTAGGVASDHAARFGCPPVIATPCPADLDGSDTVNGLDLAQLLSQWGCTGAPGACTGDLTGDGVVSGLDLAQLLAAWGACP